MSNENEKNREVEINHGYELYQIITDFGEPLEIFREAFQNAIDEDAKRVFCKITRDTSSLSSKVLYIDIWNDGYALSRDNVKNFFGLSCSTKVDTKLQPRKGKFGYKGHGSKIFFNAEKVQICSKNGNEQWIVELDNPLKQIEDSKPLTYSDFIAVNDESIKLPNDWEHGFFIRIINPKHFPDESSQYKLNHIYLRDYIMWYTIFGSIQILDDNFPLKDVCLYLHGLAFEDFKDKITQGVIVTDHNSETEIHFELVADEEYERIKLGHIFPKERKTEREMNKYKEERNSSKDSYDFYCSRFYKKGGITTKEGYNYNLIISFEGSETKRTYDFLLSKKNACKELLHTEAERYGLWACKGGVPIQRIDEWIEGGKGTYTYMQGFIDCDLFRLTANRGSIQNTEISVINSIKSSFNKEFNDDKIASIRNEREDIEAQKKHGKSLKRDKLALKTRRDDANMRKSIELPNLEFPNHISVLAPSQKKSGISESETMVLLVSIMSYYPQLFDFKLLDYDTTVGIDFVVEDNEGNPKYIELKGTLKDEQMNHPFQLVNQFICYNTTLKDGTHITDNQGDEMVVQFEPDCEFISNDERFNGKKFKYCQLIPTKKMNSKLKSIGVIILEEILQNVIGANIK